MKITTKKYKLDPEVYRGLGMNNILTVKPWIFVNAVPAVIALIGLLLPGSIWWILGGIVLYLLYILFWYIQFMGMSQTEQGQMLFEKVNYEITSQNILVKINTKQGYPITWKQVSHVKVRPDYFAVFMEGQKGINVHIIHLPTSIFNSPNEIRFFESVLKSKGFVTEEELEKNKQKREKDKKK
ncbi:MAG: hypothetical protein GY827_01005 [Cytophagales bacterium]|nr:hypothetical protein [Cytophagales bacterium]